MSVRARLLFRHSAISLGAVALAAAARWLLDGPLEGSAIPYSFFYPAVLLAASLSGTTWGLVSTIAAAAVGTVLFLDAPLGTRPADSIQLGLFMVNSSLLSVFCGALRAARMRLARTVDESRQAERERNELTRALLDSRERTDLLAEAGRVLSQSLDYDMTLRSLARLVVPGIADYAIIYEAGDQGAVRQVAWAHADPAKEELLAAVAERYRVDRENPASPVARVMASGASQLLAEIAPDTAQRITSDPELLELYRRLGPRSCVVVPLVARGELLGAMFLVTAESGRRYGPADVAFAEDLAARAAAAVDNASLYGRAEAASQSKDRFLAALSHELRTPLAPVLLKLDALRQRGGVPAELCADLDMIQRSVELEARLIDDLLDLTRVASGKLELHCEVVDVHALIEHVVGVYCAGDLDGKELRLEVELAAGRHHVWADPARLQQVLWNLVKNAVKFTPAGGRIALRTADDGDGRLRVEVADDGVGIEPEALPRIFDAFEQAHRTMARASGGLGLGLAIAKSLVDLHGGTLTAASEGRGRGSTFALSVPAVIPPASEPAAGEARPIEAPPRLRLLLVEDHPETLAVMAELLGIRHEVATAADVAAALAIAAERELDLVVSDLGLPDGSGLDLMRELRARHGLAGIAMSGYGMDEDVRKSREAGFAEHLTKPVDFDALRASISRVARAAAMGAETRSAVRSGRG